MEWPFHSDPLTWYHPKGYVQPDTSLLGPSTETFLNARNKQGSGNDAYQPSDDRCGVAFLTFHKETTQQIRDYVARKGLLPPKAEDIAEIVWLKFIENGPNFADAKLVERCRAWLLQVAHNEVVNHFRDSGHQPEQWRDDPSNEPPARCEYDRADHEQLLRRSERFRSWLEELRPEHPLRYELVFARHIEGVRPKELAANHGRTSHWVSVQINRAIEHFLAWLKKHPLEDEED